MAKTRVHELAKEMEISSKELLDKLIEIGLPVKNHMSTIPSEEVKRIKGMVLKLDSNEKETSKENKNQIIKNNNKEQVKKMEIKENIENKYGNLSSDSNNNKAVSSKPKKTGDTNRRNFPKNKNNKKYRGNRGKDNRVKEALPEVKRHITLEDSISVQDLAHQLGKKSAEVIKKLMQLGTMATINQELDPEMAQLIAEEFGATVEIKASKEEELFAEVVDKEEDLTARPPVVTIMGHVDHGKTSLLDKIREANVTASEMGGITQHIGAYQVEVREQKITFLDTPGHEAFTAMRARGASITDIAILVVAVDDGVMPQTKEAIHHAKAANVPIIVAINKVDKPEANPDKIRQELTEFGLIAEDWGGDTIMVPVSALTGEGIENLLEMIILVSEMSELKANPNRKARGTVIEAKLDKNRGSVATLLVQNGSLHIGDFLIVGTTQGRVRAMLDYKGRKLKSAGPSSPVEILGMSEVPSAGDDFISVEDEKLAKQIAEKRFNEKHLESISARNKVSLEDLFSQIQQGEVRELNIILKADVQGSIEAIQKTLEQLSNEEVRVNIIHSAVGGIKETDVMLATASNAIIIGFNVRPDSNAKKIAENEEVDIRNYRVIYDAVDDIKAALSGLLAPEIKEVELGQAEVRALFKVPKVGVISGCYVTEGKITRSAKVRIVRDGVIIHEGEIDSLKRFKDDVREVAAGYECGIGVVRFNDLKEGDIIEAYTFEEIKREL